MGYVERLGSSGFVLVGLCLCFGFKFDGVDVFLVYRSNCKVIMWSVYLLCYLLIYSFYTCRCLLFDTYILDSCGASVLRCVVFKYVGFVLASRF